MAYTFFKKAFKFMFVFFAGTIIVSILAIIGLYWASGADMWEKQGKILQNDQPYGGGLLMVRDGKYLMLKVSSPPTPFKNRTDEEILSGKPVEFTEPWMINAGEVLNRTSVRLIHGDIAGSFHELFKNRGQSGYWWVSANWQTIYITTRWIDYSDSKTDKLGSLHKLWKTLNGGKAWDELTWPSKIDPGVPLFTPNGRNGYLIAPGPKIWRTEDGGKNWEEIRVPSKAHTLYDNEKEFPVFEIDDLGTLYFTIEDEVINATYLYMIPWGQMTNYLTNSSSYYIKFDSQRIIDIARYKDGPLYVLTNFWTRSETATSTDFPPGGVLSRIDGRQVVEVATVKAPISVASILPGRDGLLMIWGSRPGSVIDKPIVLIGNSEGKKWKEIPLNRDAQGWYFDPDNNVLWRYLLESIYKMQL